MIPRFRFLAVLFQLSSCEKDVKAACTDVNNVVQLKNDLYRNLNQTSRFAKFIFKL